MTPTAYFTVAVLLIQAAGERIPNGENDVCAYPPWPPFARRAALTVAAPSTGSGQATWEGGAGLRAGGRFTSGENIEGRDPPCPPLLRGGGLDGRLAVIGWAGLRPHLAGFFLSYVTRKSCVSALVLNSVGRDLPERS